MKKMCVWCLGVVLILGNLGFADDLIPPPWRGADRTVKAEFDSWNNFSTGTINPDSWSSKPPGGWTWGPHASLTGNPILGDFAGRTSVILLSASSSKLTFELPNYDQNPEKEVWVQITYQKPQGQSVPGFNVWASLNEIPIPGYNGDFIGATLMGSVNQENNWVTEAFSFFIRPNPDQEAFTLNFNNYPAYIDQVVVDTICPEPATLMLLAVGGLALVRRKK